MFPASSLVMGLSLFAGILGVLWEGAGQMLFWPLWMILVYIKKVVEFSAYLPFAVVGTNFFTWHISLLYLALLSWSVKYFKLEK